VTTVAVVPELARPADQVETAYLAPEAVLYDAATGRVHLLNPGAAAVWMLLDGRQDARGLAAELGELFGRSAGELLPEVTEAIADFAQRGLLDGTDHGAGRAEGRAAQVLARPPDP
jgi:hypothetical protein